MTQTMITIEGDNAVLQGEADTEWLECDAVASLEDWA
jgi:hypothetical protein